jgi:hypothetical protein
MLRYAENAAYAGVCSECKSTVKAKSEKCNKNAIADSEQEHKAQSSYNGLFKYAITVDKRGCKKLKRMRERGGGGAGTESVVERAIESERE